MKKSKWDNALKISKKAKDKSIYNLFNGGIFLPQEIKLLIMTINFIRRNENYPRIGRIKYLSEHKLSTDKVSPKK